MHPFWKRPTRGGPPPIDHQHRELQAVIEHLAAHPEATARSRPILEALDRLMRYGSNHLHAEEALLRVHGYPELDSHAEDHRRFRHMMALLSVAATSGVGEFPAALVDEVPAVLRDFVTRWWNAHVLVADRRCARFLEDRGVV